jgi:hypothetical protein
MDITCVEINIGMEVHSRFFHSFSIHFPTNVQCINVFSGNIMARVLLCNLMLRVCKLMLQFVITIASVEQE